MNRKRKILTLVALAVFGAIIALHYVPSGSLRWEGPPMGVPGGWRPLGIIDDVRLPLFVLAVFYAGLFFLFGGKDAAPVPRRPRNWRLIVGVILAGLVVASLVAAIICVQEQAATRRREIEWEKREQAKKTEEEASKHRITSSEIDLIDLRLERLSYEYLLTGRIRNRTAHNSTLNSITLIVTLREKEGSPDILGEKTVQIEVEVPPHQTREFNESINSRNLPKLTQFAWTHAITEIRGSKGHDLPNWFELNAPTVSPTPSPTP